MLNFMAGNKTLDSLWEENVSPRVYSYKTVDKLIFYSSFKQLVEHHNDYDKDNVKSYGIFVPDDLIKNVSGLLPSSRRAKTKTVIAYVDGAYSNKDNYGSASYGVFLVAGEYTSEYCNVIHDNIAMYAALGAELASAIVAIKEAIRQGYKEIIIHYDFNGIKSFDGWHLKENRKDTNYNAIVYQYSKFLECIKGKIQITWQKVKAHDCDMGNEHANYLATISARKARIFSEKMCKNNSNKSPYKPRKRTRNKKNNDSKMSYPHIRKRVTPFLNDSRLITNLEEKMLVELMLQDKGYAVLCHQLNVSVGEMKKRKCEFYQKLTNSKTETVPQNHQILYAVIDVIEKIQMEDQKNIGN